MVGAVKVLRDLSREAPLTFVTACPLKEPIELWLENVLGRNVFSSARLIAIGDHDGKADHIKELGLEYFVDDRAERPAWRWRKRTLLQSCSTSLGTAEGTISNRLMDGILSVNYV